MGPCFERGRVDAVHEHKAEGNKRNSCRDSKDSESATINILFHASGIDGHGIFDAADQ